MFTFYVSCAEANKFRKKKLTVEQAKKDGEIKEVDGKKVIEIKHKHCIPIGYFAFIGGPYKRSFFRRLTFSIRLIKEIVFVVCLFFLHDYPYI